jgi:ankyrin repeat protein
MIKYNQYIKENNKSNHDWFNYRNDSSIIKKLINNGYDINIQDNNGNTLLMYSIINKNDDVFNLLISQPDIDVNIQNNYKWSALKYAAFHGNYYVIEELLKRPDIDITLKDLNNNTFIYNMRNKEILKKYSLQKKILDNNREDIILYFNNYDLVHPNIKKEYPDLIKAANWGLVS